jgi:hypothetical protein
MYAFRELPHYFAILRPTSGGGPSYQLCEAALSRYNDEDNDEIEFTNVKNLELDTAVQNQCVRLEASHETSLFFSRVKNEAHMNQDIRQIKWWFLPHILHWESSVFPVSSIPVIDSNKRFYLTRTFHRVVPVNLTSNEWEQTVLDYGNRNRQVYDLAPREHHVMDIRGQVPRRSRSPLWGLRRTPSITMNAPPIPSYVMDLLIKDATETKKSCPITMLAFSELQSIGITPCFHLFELDSLERWKEEHGTCPLCRSAIFTIHVWKRPSSDA